jgi:hypothetical protein
MPDQDKQTGHVGEPSGSEGRVLLRVPARITDWLREGVFARVGSAGEAVNEWAFADGRETHPEWFRRPTGDLLECYALLDAIGWAKTIPPVDARLELREHHRALLKALEAALGFAEEDASEAVRRNAAEHPGQGQPAEHDVEIERVGELRDFIAVAQARIDVLADKDL